MADEVDHIVETPGSYPTDITLIKETDPVQGGADGVANKQATELANRTGYLLASLLQLNSFLSSQVPFLNLGDFTYENAEFGSAVSVGLSFMFTIKRKPDETYQLTLSTHNGETVEGCEFWVRQYGESSFKSFRKSNVSITPTGVDVFESPIPFTDQTELEVLVDGKGTRFKAGVSGDFTKAYVWGQSMTMFLPT